MDHRDLLKKYIRLVRDSEGATFIPCTATDRTVTGALTVSLSAEEVAELQALDDESTADDHRE
jgi:hypothetical protein